MNDKSLLSIANEKFKLGKLKEAINYYKLARNENPKLEKITSYNIDYAKRKLKDKSKIIETPHDKLFKKTSKQRKKIITALKNSIHDKELTLKIIERSAGDKKAFNSSVYLAMYPDIESAINDRVFTSAKQHFEMFGKNESRVHSYQSYIDKLKQELNVLKAEFIAIESLFNQDEWPTVLDETVENYNIAAVPFYLENASHINLNESIEGMRVGVHLHLYYTDLLNVISQHLNNIPVDFDLFISTPHDVDHEALKNVVSDSVTHVKVIQIKRVPNRGRDIAPFIIEFGNGLQAYDAICHIHTKKSEHTKALSEWGDDILDSLLGSREGVKKILTLLKGDAKIIYPDGQNYYMKDPTGWSENREIAKHILSDHLDTDISNFPKTEFPEGSMFWARQEGIQSFLNIPLDWDDFPEEPIPTDGTLAHALERIILISSCAAPGRIFKLIKNDYLNNKIYFENKKSYVGKIKENTVKILSFYLPQFHPIPENDEWHGKGFTEWTKVKASTPLFKGHYQQHRPHEDIGYYLLDSPAILKKQASLMRDAGVHGQIFYHYWFSGKLILEEPVKILLENKDVEMPFCFCWANENWTKRWDGNDAEVLLAQHYSASDARDFINYLIPFLKDERYIKIAGRPVLYIYRPSSIPDPHLYIDIWNKICAQHGVPPLYITAILTRGAHDPRDYGMDGALERVLHDWTGGNTSEIKDSLQKYWPVNGSVLDYGDVATYYAKQDASKEFEYFRSLVPTWDNTARYGSESYVVHESTPEKFQGWLEQSIAFTKANLPEDRHLVVINAWNEWAEGAHLEPDTYSGYAYLNSVGRALSGIKYQDDKPTAAVANTKLVVEIELPEYLTNNLNHDKFVSAKFFRHLAEAIKNYKLTVFIKNTEAVKRLKELKCNVKDNPPKKIDCTLQFRQLALISDTFITEILKTHNSFKDSVIISNEYGRHHILQEYYGLDSVTRESAYENSVILIPSDRKSDTYKISHKARAFSTQTSTLPSAEMPEITTVIRFHKNDSILELKNALLSLSAVHSCVVKPVICAQDLKPHQLKELTELCAKFEYKGFTDVKINKFFSSNNNSDIRAKLLHEGLKAAESRYVAFLDHDDLMMCNSYAYLVNRLNITGKAVSFGRVYDTAYESNKEKLIKRNKTYEYGFTYNDFLDVNHAPLHSFLMDTTKVDISSIHYFEDQKFMEDYYLTLQIFDGENTDWASLQDNFYVGDYLHCTDRSHTLAITNTASRSSVITNTEFEKCKKRVEDLKVEIKKKLNSH